MALGVAGVAVGTWTAPGGVSGCTVLLPPQGTIGAVAVRGAAPGTREAAALSAFGRVEVCHAVVLAGGSAYGLAAADGVMGWLEERGRGFPVPGGVVPIVGAAILLDAAVADPSSRPGPGAGRAACEAAADDEVAGGAGVAADAEVAEGVVGVGAGCTVAKVAGLAAARPSGQGVAVRSAGGVTVAALVANNALGEVVAEDGTWIAHADIPEDAPRFPLVDPFAAGAAGPRGSAGPAASAGPTASAGPGASAGPTANTVIGCIVTDARLSKRDAARVADLGHSGIARAVRPAHTQADGDALFCLATGGTEASVDLVAHLAAEAVADACRRGPLLAAARRG